MLKRASRWLMVAPLALAMAGCSDSNPPQTASAAPLPKPEPTAPAADPAAVTASGPLVVENQVDVMAQRDGMVATLRADTGTTVHKGQLLAELDSRQLQADREAAQAKVRSIEYDQKNWEARMNMDRVDLERSEKMMAADLITKEQLEHARFKYVATQNELEREKQDYLNAKALLQALDLEIEKTHIKAPFDGVVARRYVRVGQKVSKDDRLFWVTAVAPLRVRFTLPEKYVGRIKPGESLDVSAAAPEMQKYGAKVIQVSPVVDPASGTIEVLAELTGKPQGLHPGMTVSVQLPPAR